MGIVRADIRHGTVIDVESRVEGFPLEGFCFAWRDMGYCSTTAWAGDGMKVDIVIVKTGFVIGETEFDGVTFADAKHWARDLFVVGPIIEINVRCNFGDYFLSSEADAD